MALTHSTMGRPGGASSSRTCLSAERCPQASRRSLRQQQGGAVGRGGSRREGAASAERCPQASRRSLQRQQGGGTASECSVPTILSVHTAPTVQPTPVLQLRHYLMPSEAGQMGTGSSRECCPIAAPRCSFPTAPRCRFPTAPCYSISCCLHTGGRCPRWKMRSTTNTSPLQCDMRLCQQNPGVGCQLPHYPAVVIGHPGLAGSEGAGPGGNKGMPGMPPAKGSRPPKRGITAGSTGGLQI